MQAIILGCLRNFDIVLMLNYIMGLTDLTQVQFFAADLNENGLINVLDIIQLVNLILET